MQFKYLLLLLSLSANFSVAAPPTGDTQGKVSAVRVQNTVSGTNSFRVYFSNIENDRFNCIQDDGYVTIKENGPFVSSESYKAMYSAAIAALASGKTLALDSPGTTPCDNANIAMLLAN